MRLTFIILTIFLFSLASADCSKNQIDINSASLEGLDEIIWVGPATAQKIVDTRPYATLDDIKKVSGIGDIKLQDIKDQGLACTEGDAKESENEKEDAPDAKGYTDRRQEESVSIVAESTIVLIESTGPISLNKEPKEELIYISKNAKVIDNLAYAFSIFLIFIIGILMWERF